MRILSQLIHDKFKSGNFVEVDRIVITRAEYEAKLAKPEPKTEPDFEAEIKRLKDCLFQMQNAAIELSKPKENSRKEWIDLSVDQFKELLKLTIHEVDKNKFTESEGVLFFGALVQAKIKELNA